MTTEINKEVLERMKSKSMDKLVGIQLFSLAIEETTGDEPKRR